jgi:hypothetical protein
MSDHVPRPTIGPGHRIIAVTAGLSMMGLLAGWAFTAIGGEVPHPLLVVLWLVMLAMGSVFVWIGLFSRAHTAGELESLDSLPLPEHSGDSLICRFASLGGGVRTVIVDFAREVVHFRGCHTPRTFLAVAQRDFRCPFADLVAADRHRHKGDWLAIATTSGKAFVPSSATNYERLCERIVGCVPAGRSPPDTEHPLMGLVYVAGMLGGLFMALSLVPRNASIGTVAMYMGMGAATGMFVAHAFVTLAGRILERSLVVPLGMGVFGAGCGLACGNSLAQANQWNPWFLVMPVLLGSLTGFAVGLVQQGGKR